MLEFITRFFRREEASKNLAKERLRLVLMSDRVSLAPDIFETMKVEMLDVIRRYLEVDERALEMRFENAERQFLLLANIPVLHVKSHMPKPATVQSPSAPPNGSAHSPAPEQPAPAAEEAQAPSASMAIDAERSKAAPAKADAQGSAPKRRRRKRKKTSPAGASQTIAIPQPVGDPPTIPPADQ